MTQGQLVGRLVTPGHTSSNACVTQHPPQVKATTCRCVSPTPIRKGGINTETDHSVGITSFRALPSPHDHSNTSTTTMKAVFAFLALFAIFAIAFAQESAPKESLKGSEAVYLASPYGYAGYAGYGAYPYAGYGVGYNAYSGLYYR
uniref:Uncharacterized protein n=5 Tax=Timema TaxID=61471 RepID=A0A7R9AX72_TIMSH|nr:unnamed protein product [Timema shepardi]